MELTPIEDRVPLPANPTGEDVMETLFRIYRKPHIREVVVREGEIVVRRQGFEGDPLLESDGVEPHHVFSRTEMEEVDSGEPYKTLFTMFFRVNVAGYEVSHVFVGNTRKLRRWLSLPEMVSLGGRMFGARVSQEPSLPDDVLLICGSSHRGMDVGAIQFILKVSMLEEDERAAIDSEGPGDGDRGLGDEGAPGEVGIEWGHAGGGEGGPDASPGRN